MANWLDLVSSTEFSNGTVGLPPDRRKQGVVPSKRPRRMTRCARFAMSTLWREGRAIRSSSSPDDRHPDGLGNSSGQLGRHYTTKMLSHINLCISMSSPVWSW
jgi:hypothetical protein